MLLAYYTLKTIKALITIRGFIKFVGCERRSKRTNTRDANFNRMFAQDAIKRRIIATVQIFFEITHSGCMQSFISILLLWSSEARRIQLREKLASSDNFSLGNFQRVFLRGKLSYCSKRAKGDDGGGEGKKDHLYRRNFIIELRTGCGYIRALSAKGTKKLKQAKKGGG